MHIAKLHSADGRKWLAGLMTRGDASIVDSPEAVSSLSDVMAYPGDAVLILEDKLRKEFEQSAPALWPDFAPGKSTFMALVPRGEAPRVDPIYGSPVASFLCSTSLFQSFLEMGIECWPETLLFAVLHFIANGAITVDRLLVRQLSTSATRAHCVVSPRTSVIVPHRGDQLHLRTALRYLSRASGNLSIHVGLDVDDPATYHNLVRENPAAKFYRANPAPLGPYVIRQHLAEQTLEPFLCLQDSDDVSCYDRFATLAAALAEDGCGMTGSHELCLDEIRAVVYPVRYPLDASAALTICPNHALLHGTLMSHRHAFFQCGGLSTHLPIANDTQFLLRAFFSMRIRNVDEFLYIRRRHPTSLTNAPETVYDNPQRRKLNAQWSADFEAIKRSELRLEESSLRPMRRTESYAIDPIALAD